MLNHVRTLLLNLSGPISGAGYPGDELVPADYAAVELPTYLQTVRRMLFGAAPDRVMLNYRLRQLMPLLHAGPLTEYVTELDRRVTYLEPDRTFLAHQLYQPQVEQLSGPGSATLTALGAPAPPDVSGRMSCAYRVTMIDADRLRFRSLVPPMAQTDRDIEMAGGLSRPILLPESGYAVRLGGLDAGASWQVSALNRPAWGPGQLLANLGVVGEPALDALFGVDAAEPYQTFRAVWRQGRDVVARLSAALLAIVYRTDERRTRG